MKVKRHVLATTNVEVYRLFKIRDAASAISHASDPLVVALGRRIVMDATAMLDPYCDGQNRATARMKPPRRKRGKRR